MQKLVFIDENNNTMTIGYSRPYWLSNLVGMSDCDIDNLYDRGYHQNGQTTTGRYLQARTVMFTVTVLADTMLDSWQKRHSLIAFFNPEKVYDVIYYNDYVTKYFTCYPSFPEFTSKQNHHSNIQSAFMTLTCDDPYLYDLETTINMTYAMPLLHLPYGWTEETVAGLVTNKQVDINNTGTVETPIEIQISGGITNPIIYNNTTGKQIKINKAVEADEVLIITTGYNNKRVWLYKDGTYINASDYFDYETSDYFSLAVGINNISYAADSGEDTAQLTIKYRTRCRGV